MNIDDFTRGADDATLARILDEHGIADLFTVDEFRTLTALRGRARQLEREFGIGRGDALDFAVLDLGIPDPPHAPPPHDAHPMHDTGSEAAP